MMEIEGMTNDVFLALFWTTFVFTIAVWVVIGIVRDRKELKSLTRQRVEMLIPPSRSDSSVFKDNADAFLNRLPDVTVI